MPCLAPCMLLSISKVNLSYKSKLVATRTGQEMHCSISPPFLSMLAPLAPDLQAFSCYTSVHELSPSWCGQEAAETVVGLQRIVSHCTTSVPL